MPNRLIREGILSSEMINKLTCEEEVFYRRLLNVVDDYGRFYAHPSLLLAACYPLKLDSVKISDIEKWLKTVVDVRESADDKLGLIIIYKVGVTKYLQVVNFKQQIRSKSKFPQPSDINCYTNDEQLHSKCIANDHVDVSVSVSESVVEDEDVDVDGVVSESEAPKNPGAKSIRPFFCKREGKKIESEKHGSYVLITADEYKRMVADWGKTFTDNAICEYDIKYPNSPAIRKHTDHNRGIRDYVNRGYICQGKTPRPATAIKPADVKKENDEDLGTPEERASILRMSMPSVIRNGKELQPIGEILTEMIDISAKK